MRSQEVAKSATATRRKRRCFTKSIRDQEADFAAVFGCGGVEESADGLDGLAALADDARKVGSAGLHGKDIAALDGGVRDERLVGMRGEAAEDEIKEFLHGCRRVRRLGAPF